MEVTVGIYDILVVVLILGATFFGWRKGLATQVASIVSIVASFAVAVRYREPVAAHIDAAEPWNRFAAMLILYLGTSLVIWLIFRQVRTTIDRWKLGEFDRQMGAVFGAVKGVALASVITLFAFTLLQEPQRQAIIHSKSGVWIARLIRSSTAIMPPEILQFVGPYLDALDQGFGTNGSNIEFAQPASPRAPGDGLSWPIRPGSGSPDPSGYPTSSYPTSSYPTSLPAPYEFRPVAPDHEGGSEDRRAESRSPYR
jgi:membrane protein required for colicin V production